MAKLKGSLKDPLLYLGCTSAILFTLFFFKSSFFQPVAENGPAFLISKIGTDSLSQDPTVYLTQKSKPESPDFLLVEGRSLLAATPPAMVTPQILGALVEGFEPEDVQKIIVEYIVEPGDTLWSIAEKFNVSLNTVLWANNLNQNSIIQPGQKLVIPPVSGVIHHVKAGETVSEIAKKYQAKSEEIITFNELSSEGDIYPGDVIVVPNGVMPPPQKEYVSGWAPIASSYFICPISLPCRLTQGLHWYNAVDFSHGSCGEPIFAAAGGKVLKVKLTNSTSRWAFGGAGNYLTILHPNGVVTMYGHIASSLVNPGEQVFQGQIIAFLGGQPGTSGAGKSTGCHVHFGVSGARNPFAR